jgi:uncharacterized membrane protein (DUF106 family)
MVLLDALLTPVFTPLLALGPFWAIVIIALFVSLLITVIYKFATDQELMKSLKAELKSYQEQMKQLKDNPQKAMEVQKLAMKKNMEYMKHSFKPTLITFLPIILIFGWMNAHLMYEPIYPGETYTVTAVFKEGVEGTAELIPDEGTHVIDDAVKDITREVTWKLKSTEEGIHTLSIAFGDQLVSKNVLITKELKYEEPVTTIPHSDLERVQINYHKLRPLGNVSILGWKPGWLGVYIIFSIIFSMGLRKLFKLH